MRYKGIDFKRYNFTNILGWSHSRSYIFNQCKRKYYYNYYGSKYAPTWELQNKISFLKKLSSIPLMQGIIIHECFENILNRINHNAFDIKLKDIVDPIVEERLRDSEFFEEYYNTLEHNLNMPKYFIETASNAIENMINHNFYDWLKKNVKPENQWIIEPPYYGETRLENEKVYFKPDFILITSKYVYIIDWKTGKFKKNDEQNKEQLLGYNMWIKDVLGSNTIFNLEDKTFISYLIYLLPELKHIKYKLNFNLFDNYKTKIFTELKKMRNYCIDIDNNIPKNIEEFEMNKFSKCKYCNYKELCDE